MEMPHKMQKITKLVPPDGGWGWVMLFGIAVSNSLNFSLPSIFSLLYGDALEAMGHKTQGAALVSSTVYFVSIFGGPASGAMVKLTSPRVVAVTGAFLCSSGIFFSTFSTNIWHLVITFGVMLGLGIDAITVSSFVAINSYFDKRKSRAVGFALVGTSLGQIAMPHIVRALLENYGFRGACMFMSSISFHGVAGCLLMQPVKRHMKKIENEEIITKIPIEVCENKQNDDFPKKHPKQNGDMQENDKQLNERHAGNIVDNPVPGKSVFRKIYDVLDIALLRNIRFINIIVGLAICAASTRSFSMLYPLFLQKHVLLDKQQTANCMSAIAIADVMGRFFIPIVQDKYRIKGRWIFIITCTWLIITRQILAHQSMVEVLLTISALYGFGRSMTIVQRNIVISENCRTVQVPAAVGLGRFMEGSLTLPLGYLLGWIRDYTDNYIAALAAQDCLLVIVLATWIPDMLYLYIKQRKLRIEKPNLVS